MKSLNAVLKAECTSRIVSKSGIADEVGDKNAPSLAEIRERAFEIHIERGDLDFSRCRARLVGADFRSVCKQHELDVCGLVELLSIKLAEARWPAQMNHHVGEARSLDGQWRESLFLEQGSPGRKVIVEGLQVQ